MFFIVFLIALEVILRVFGVNPQIPFFHQAGPYRTDPDLVWAFQPNYQGKIAKGIEIRTNSLGLRCEEVAKQKPADTFRILALGGSVTAGTDVQFPETYGERLEEGLQSRFRGKVEVINAGVPGYSPIQYINFLSNTGLSLDPDFVLLDFSINDVLEGRLPASTFGLKPEFRANGAFLRLDGGLDARSRLISRLTDLPRYTSAYTAGRWISKKLFRGRNQNMFRWIERELLSENPSALVTESWAKTESQLLEIRDLARSRGVPFAIVMLPLQQQVEARDVQDRPQLVMKKFCEENRIILIDLLPSFRKKNQQEKSVRYFLDADHLSPAGHRLVAENVQAGLSPLFARSFLSSRAAP